MERKKQFPFTAILGQERMKEALVLNLVDPSIGGVLIRGQKGTAKTTAVRGLSDVMAPLKVVELPVGATEDRVAGTLDVEYALKTGEKKFEPGILAQADKQILYVDEINLLDDHIVDLLLDAAATGVNTVEREGISCSHPARFILVGTMNPEEGSLRPQLLDRFGMVVDVAGVTDPEVRARIIEDRLAYEEDPQKFCRGHAKAAKTLAADIKAAKKRLPGVAVSHDLMLLAAQIGIGLGTEGHRSDISMIKAARAAAALRGGEEVSREDLKKAALYTLPHRMRKGPLDMGQLNEAKLDEILAEHGETREQEEPDRTPGEPDEGRKEMPGTQNGNREKRPAGKNPEREKTETQAVRARETDQPSGKGRKRESAGKSGLRRSQSSDGSGAPAGEGG